jgi:hypothetical protein
MIGELERMQKEAVVAQMRYYPGIFLEFLRKTTEELRIVGFPDEILTEHLPNTTSRPVCTAY